MTESSAPTLEDVVAVLAEDAEADYRLDAATAKSIIEESTRHDRKLHAAIAKAPDLARLARTRAYRDARKRARKKIYYALRQYKRSAIGGQDDLPALTEALQASEEPESRREIVERMLSCHVSTRERLSSREAFDEGLARTIGTPGSVLDVGCGIFPLMFPFTSVGARLDRYLALDCDADSIDALRTWADIAEPRLTACRWDIEEGWTALAERTGCPLPEGGFDVGLLLKVVPVVARQNPALLDILAQVPARRLVVSGSRVALAKRTDIEHRERALLGRFVKQLGARVTDEIVVDEEFALVLELPGRD